jgi:uncharacterized membrane protein
MTGESSTFRTDRNWLAATLLRVLGTPEFATLTYAAVVVVAVSGTVDWLPLSGRIRVVLGAGFVCFVPGYAVLAALYPAQVGRTERSGIGGPALPWRERVALSFALSLALLAVVGVVLAAVGAGFSARTVTGAVLAVAVTGVLVGGVRRLRLPPDERHAVPYGRWLGELRAAVSAERGRRERVLNATLVLVATVAVVALVGALAAPSTGEAYSDLYLLTETDGGEEVAADYPESLIRGSSYRFYVGIDNHERERTTYWALAELQRVRTSGTELTVVERETLDQFSVTLDPGERVSRARSVTPRMGGEDLRLVYYLYRGEPPATPSTESAYRSVHIWIDVNASDE